ncbi:MAG TPA: histidine kinase [Pilimelia sp.]|nr:histidine kinase [Pilimelia sp.]
MIGTPDLAGRLDQSLRFSLLANVCGTVGVLAVRVFVVPEPWLLLVLGLLLAHQAAVGALVVLLRRRRLSTAQVASLFCLADWMITLAVTALAPAGGAVLVPIVVVRVVTALPYLRGASLARLLAGCALAGSLVAAASRFPVEALAHDVPGWVVTAFVLVFVPAELIVVGVDLWHHHQGLADVAERALTANAALQRSQAALAEQAEHLRESRARIVAAGDAQRRRIERDLHDGAQQHLAAVAMGVSLLRQRVPQGDVAAVLAQLEDETHKAVEELRRLARGLYPATLVTQGVVPALRAAGRRCAAPVVVNGEPFRVDPAIEAAVYFCCLEALHNAVAHGGAQVRVEVEVTASPERLCFAVRDDGGGFDPAVPATGSGLVNMGDRLAAVGGTLSIRSSAAGTAVLGRVPLTAGGADTARGFP